MFNDDAAKLDLPDEVTVIYFYNPFVVQVLASVIDKIHESLRRHKRPVTIVYLNRAEFERQTIGSSWIKKQDTLSLGFPPIGCGIYQCEVTD